MSPASPPPGEPEHIRINRAGWDAYSADYEQQHGAQLDAGPMAWGVWSIPESRLQVLGEIADLRVLELGCGAARWARALAREGALPVGLDLSGRQLEVARRTSAHDAVIVPLVQASAEYLPLADGCFDLVFCDHGATSFSDPYRTVPEAARVLKPGGRLVFNMSSPFHDLCYDIATETVTSSLQRNYSEVRKQSWVDEVTFQLPYGEWIRLFRQNGLEVEDLIELAPEENATTTYDDYVPLGWARRWPAENIWKARKAR
ncbi:MAG: class I SAM-dependent methyltransferase [Actinobacteria bacterium]|nr:class I SAM-dependent methyltransferase [Actinomycetota bacterium]